MRSKALLKAFRKESQERPPFWFMRQAGRYLPEYKQVRAHTGGFLDLCYNPQKAAEVTIQPITRFGMSAAIIFSDILVVPHALGAGVSFQEGEGPLVKPVDNADKLAQLSWNPEFLAPVYEALRLTKSQLPDETTLIGFAGAPWTLACYMVQGKSDKDWGNVRTRALKDSNFFAELLSVLTVAVTEHLKAQIRAGAEVVQIFDSWSGVLSAEEFAHYVIAPTKAIVAGVKKEFPNVPIIGFPRLAGVKYWEYAEGTKVDGISVDPTVPLEYLQQLQSICVVQGNLDSILLAESKEATLFQAKRIVDALGDKSFVFNLGHGILPHTPIENVAALSAFLKG